ncbi:MAG: hypothetical protein ABI298_09240 [Acidimicrobiales bacterium]
MSKQQRQILLAIIAPIAVLSSALAWRDLARRTNEQVRGRKNVWRVIITMNPGNSLIYWLFGRA